MSARASTPIQAVLAQLQTGNESARGELLRVARDRLLAQTRAHFARFARLRRWEGSDDVLQGVLLRLVKCLDQHVPSSTREFFALSGTLVRNELVSLVAKHFGPLGVGTNHVTPAAGDLPRAPALDSHRDGRAADPAAQASLAELHALIGTLPAEDREIFDLHFYGGLSHKEAAAVLGVCERTAKRRWMTARVRLGHRLGGEFRNPPN